MVSQLYKSSVTLPKHVARTHVGRPFHDIKYFILHQIKTTHTIYEIIQFVFYVQGVLSGLEATLMAAAPDSHSERKEITSVSVPIGCECVFLNPNGQSHSLVESPRIPINSFSRPNFKPAYSKAFFDKYFGITFFVYSSLRFSRKIVTVSIKFSTSTQTLVRFGLEIIPPNVELRNFFQQCE